MIKLKEALRGSMQSLMLKGINKQSPLSNFDDDEELKEFSNGYSMTPQTFKMVKADLKQFIRSEHEKIKNPDIGNSLRLIKALISNINLKEL